jgi:hypothetical protein
MSRGPGRIERLIEQLFLSNPDRTFTAIELAERAYPELDRTKRGSPKKKHLVATLRASEQVRARLGDWKFVRAQGAGVNWCFSTTPASFIRHCPEEA